MKSELAIKRDEWFKGDDGEKCSDISTLGGFKDDAVFLRNRLEMAFLAGAAATNEIAEELAAKISCSHKKWEGIGESEVEGCLLAKCYDCDQVFDRPHINKT